MKPDPIHSPDYAGDVVADLQDQVAQSLRIGGEWTLVFHSCIPRDVAERLIADGEKWFELIPPSPVPDPPTEHPLWQPNKPA